MRMIISLIKFSDGANFLSGLAVLRHINPKETKIFCKCKKKKEKNTHITVNNRVLYF